MVFTVCGWLYEAALVLVGAYLVYRNNNFFVYMYGLTPVQAVAGLVACASVGVVAFVIAKKKFMFMNYSEANQML